MSRWPGFGRCKKRLAVGIGSAAAASIQARLRAHTLAVAGAMETEGLLDVHLAMSGGGTSPRRRRGPMRTHAQAEGRLGLRMRRELLKACRPMQPRSLLIIGTDLPNLHRRDLQRAIDALADSPLVIGPAVDGGYWLLGLGPALSQTCPSWLFSGLPWGTERVLQVTEARALEHGITPVLLACHNDIDQLDDLEPWLR